MAVSIKDILTNYEKGETKDFDILLNNLQKHDIESAYLKACLKGLKDCVLALGRSMEVVVSVILKVDWLNQDPTVIVEYQSLLVNLVSAHTYYLRAAVKMIVKSFIPKHKFPDEETTADEATRLEDEKQFLQLHHLLKTILHIVPMTPTVLIPLLSENFPYLTKHAYIQECYVRNVLHLMSYLPSDSNRLMEIIVDRMVKLDVHAPRNEIEEAEDKSDEDDGVIFEMDEFDMKAGEGSDAKTGSETQPVREGPMNHREANKLDILMQIMFDHIYRTSHKEGALDWEACKRLYQCLLYSFDHVILPTYACCHVQFLLFYICSFKEQLSEGYLDYLWRKVRKPELQPVFRQAAVAYFGSFLARANFLPLSTVKNCLEMMTEWAHQYVKEASYTTTRPDINHHGPFYSVCQALFYVLVFKHKAILESRNGQKFLESLNLQTLVTSRLNPLKICLPLVAKTFASIARIHQIAFCDTIMEHNRRSVLPVEGSMDASRQWTNINPLDSYFPFDPYVLSRSHLYIHPLYKEYDGNLTEDEDDSDGMEHEEEFYQNECSSLQGIEMASSFKSVGSDYATSPGFKLTDTV